MLWLDRISSSSLPGDPAALALRNLMQGLTEDVPRKSLLNLLPKVDPVSLRLDFR